MDNASFYYSTRSEQLCDKAGVKLLYLLPYSLDSNPIEEFFVRIKEVRQTKLVVLYRYSPTRLQSILRVVY